MKPNEFLPFASPDLGEEEIAAVTDTLRSGWLTTGTRCHEFEAEFAARVGAEHAVAVNSCTAAMHLALDAHGLSRGDYVITTPYTFAASSEVVQYFGAIPIFVDVDPQTFNMDPEGLRACLEALAAGDRSALPPALRDADVAGPAKAILPVHVGGLACDLDPIYEAAAQHDAFVIEDAAHAFPTQYKARPIGDTTATSVPSSTCFSFYATKTLTTGEGGMLVTADEAIAEQARMLSLHGISKHAWNRYGESGSWHYDIVRLGYKYNLTDVAAALGLVQLRRADEMHERRAAIAQRYSEEFKGSDALEPPSVPEMTEPSWHLYMLRLELARLNIGRGAFIDELGRAGIGASVHFIPLHLHPFYQERYGYRPSDFPVATREYEREISLPIHSTMTEGDVDRVVETVLGIADAHRA